MDERYQQSIPAGFQQNAHGIQMQGATKLHDKTATEVMIDRLQATAQRMATHNDNAAASLDRLLGGEPKNIATGRADQPTPSPVDFVSHATLLLDRIAAELERMENNSVRLARLA